MSNYFVYSMTGYLGSVEASDAEEAFLSKAGSGTWTTSSFLFDQGGYDYLVWLA